MLDRAKFILATDTIEAKLHDFLGADKFRFTSQREYDAAGRYGGQYRYEFQAGSFANSGERYFGNLLLNADNLDPEFTFVAGNLDPKWFFDESNNTHWLGLRTLIYDSLREIWPNIKFTGHPNR